MRLLAIALLLAGLGMAFMVRPDYEGMQMTGNQNLPEMNVDLQADCDSKELIVTLTDEDDEPVANGQIYLFYTDYVYQLVANGRTGADGVGRIVPLGKRDYLTDLFILRADHPQFRSTEIEFTYRRCFDAPPQPPANNATQNQSVSQTNATGPNGTVQNATQNNTAPENRTPVANATINGSRPPQPPPAAPGVPCLPALAIPLALLMRR